jgi:hypothetical protein
MLPFIGVAIIAVAAMIMLCATIVTRRPALPAWLKGEALATAVSLVVTATLALGIVVIAKSYGQAAIWQLVAAGAILIAAVAALVSIWQRFQPAWNKPEPDSPIIDIEQHRNIADGKPSKRPVRQKRMAA